MSDEIRVVEKSIEEILIDLMVEKVMSIGVQASSMRGVKESSSNAKLIPSILPNYIPSLAGTVSRDSVPRDFDYTFIIVYLSKGIRIIRP
jgi:hypothetical protein